MATDQTTTVSTPHPIDQLSVFESDLARQIVLDARGATVVINFRSIALEEPPKKELCQFLDLEHAGRVTAQTPRPARLAKVQYDVVRGNKNHEYMESWVDVVLRKEVQRRVVDKMHQAGLTLYVGYIQVKVKLSCFITDLVDEGGNSKNLQKLALPHPFTKRLLPNSLCLKALSSPSTP
jgi:hypothetical protein